jgi:hypothetical protein
MAGERSQDPWWACCSVCGNRIGIYEPVLIERPEGLIRSSYLNLDQRLRGVASRLVHEECVIPEFPPAPVLRSPS